MKNVNLYPSTDAKDSSLSQQVAQHKVLRNTYALLGVTLLFSAVIASISMALNLPHPSMMITLVGYFGLLFLTHKYRNESLGIIFVFALTGFMGMTLGPILNGYWSLAPQVVMKALGLTAVVFLGLSAYAIKSQKNFNF